LSTSVRAVRPSLPFHPAIVPSSVAKRNRSPLNALVPLKTVPVGFPIASAGLALPLGMVTVSGIFWPAPL
jgi:hypothetical protein